MCRNIGKGFHTKMAVIWEMSTYWENFFEEFELQTYSFLMMDNLGSFFDFKISPPGFTSHRIAHYMINNYKTHVIPLQDKQLQDTCDHITG